MKTLVLLLPGIPSTGVEFTSLLGLLVHDSQRTFKVITRPAHGASLPELLRSFPECSSEYGEFVYEGETYDKFVLISYSWGAYLAWKYLENLDAKYQKEPNQKKCRYPDLMVWISPTLGGDKASLFLKGLSFFSPVARVLLRGALPRQVSAYLKKTFDPETPSNSLLKELDSRLSSTELWLGALRYKLLQGAFPPQPTLKPVAKKILIFRGDRDLSAPWTDAEEMLLQNQMKQSQVITHVLKGGGHGILWTREQELAEILNAEFKKTKNQN